MSNQQSTPRWATIRGVIPRWLSVLCGCLCIGGVLAGWWFVTQGDIAEERMVSPTVLPSPGETFERLPELLDADDPEVHIVNNMLTTLRRVCFGFLLAVLVGVPLGILAGCFRVAESFLTPLIVFGRNIPIAALTILTFFIFGIGEKQKVMFIFIACVAFIIADATQAIKDVGQRYIDTAYTLGAKRRQVIFKVLVPLAMPNIFNSLRLLFGLAFGYIMLAETIKLGNEVGGVGRMLLSAQRRNIKEYVYLIVLIIPAVAFLVDYLLHVLQCNLFPFRYSEQLKRNPVLRLVQRVIRIFWRPAGSVGTSGGK